MGARMEHGRSPIRSALSLERVAKYLALAPLHDIHDGAQELITDFFEVLQALQEDFCLVAIWSKLLGRDAKVSAVSAIVIALFRAAKQTSSQTNDNTIASEAWASFVENRIQQDNDEGVVSDAAEELPQCENIYLLQFSRYPHEWRQALMEGVALRLCRDALLGEGHTCVLTSGAKVFVHPWQYNDVKGAICGMELRPYHVIVAQSLEHLVEESLVQVPRQLKVKLKSRTVVDCVGESRIDVGAQQAGPPQDLASSTDPSLIVLSSSKERFVDIGDVGFAEFFDVHRTFLCQAMPLRSSASVTQSTTEAHGGVNPRRRVVKDLVG